MLDHLGYEQAAAELERAISRVLASKKVRTPDLGGKSTTREVTDAVISEI